MYVSALMGSFLNNLFTLNASKEMLVILDTWLAEPYCMRSSLSGVMLQCYSSHPLTTQALLLSGRRAGLFTHIYPRWEASLC